tara:strand:+ start:12 stop:386 length:375 start_codon:yes stop_codon:yes gene_type:complete
MDKQPIIIKHGRSNLVSIIALIIILILAYIHFFKTDDSFQIREQVLQNQIDSLTNKVTDFKNERDSLDNNINNLNDSLFSLQSEIATKSNQINKLKKEYAKKVQHINNYTVNDINEYLTNRYKQ